MTVIEEILKQVPALAVLAYIVIRFLKHLEEGNKVIRSMHKECHDIQKETIAALKENAVASQEVRTALRDIGRIGGSVRT